MKFLSSKTAIVILFIALVCIFIFLFPIPMSRSREELYMVTETYYDEVPQIVNETVSIPYQVAKHMLWQVTWYTLTGDRKWGASIGTSTFDATLHYDWGNGIVYAGYSNYVGIPSCR